MTKRVAVKKPRVIASANVTVHLSSTAFRLHHGRGPRGWRPWTFHVRGTLRCGDLASIMRSMHGERRHSLSGWYRPVIEVGSPVVVRFPRSQYGDAHLALESLLRSGLGRPDEARVVDVEVAP